MILLSVRDLKESALEGGDYDFILLACGYEERCTNLAKTFDSALIRKSLVLCFTDDQMNQMTLESRSVFKDLGFAMIDASSSNDSEILAVFQKALQSVKRDFRILIDYTSMPRIWYARILTLCKLLDWTGTITVDFCYSIGKYGNNYSRPVEVRGYATIPGMDGVGQTSGKAMVIAALGFEGAAAHAAVERMEPDVTIALLANPGAAQAHYLRAVKENEALLAECHHQIMCPLRSVEITFRILMETVSTGRMDGHVALLCLGPKPHVLASMLVWCRFPEVSCLRMVATREILSKLSATGEIIATRVVFTGDFDALPRPLRDPLFQERYFS